jgi:uncharacterized protein YegJ (DUF2314 family)
MSDEPRLTSLDVDGWEIDDGEIAHSLNPDTFWIPELEVRQSLTAGDFAQIRFYIRTEDDAGEIEDCGERMWVQVLSKTGSWFCGELCNQPDCTRGIAPGLEVWFEARHIIDVQRADTSQPTM